MKITPNYALPSTVYWGVSLSCYIEAVSVIRNLCIHMEINGCMGPAPIGLIPVGLDWTPIVRCGGVPIGPD